MQVILDYGIGNLGSLQNALQKVGIECKVSGDIDTIKEASGIILPGVGAFGEAIREIRLRGFEQLIKDAYAQSKPILGICLGMQLAYESSFENGYSEGLGLIKGSVFKINTKHKIPHMGWNTLVERKDAPLLRGLKEEAYVYFVHSFMVSDGEEVLAYSDYGCLIPSIVRKGSFVGFQFHPEKSGTVGLSLLRNYGRMLDGDYTSG